MDEATPFSNAVFFINSHMDDADHEGRICEKSELNPSK